uniref:Uncharacterized protein n=1 Tax=Arundo donax TaxID=35708 RepID=A0A0A9ETD2_ARUDO
MVLMEAALQHGIALAQTGGF